MSADAVGRVSPGGARLHWIVSVGSLSVTATAISLFRIRSTDIFWHLATGRWILEHGAIPRSDPFRFTSGGAPWVDHEWLFQVLVRGVERLGGLDALIALRVVLVVAIALLLFRTARRASLGPPAAAVLAALALFGMRPRLILRPELLSFVALLLALQLLERLRAGRRGALYALVGLTVAWANVHGAVLLAPVAAALYLLGAWLVDGRTKQARQRLLLVPSLLLLATFVNPYGYRILGVAAGIRRAMRDLPGVNAEWAPQWLAPQPYFFCAVTLLAGLVLLARARGRRLDPASGLVAVAFGVLALTAVRHQALFFVAATPFAARTLAAVGPPLHARRALGQLAPVAPALVCGAIVLWILAPPSTGPLRPRQGAFTPGLGIERNRFPEGGADYLERHPEIGVLYNTFAHGGYLLWRLFPPRRVFHDGRMELEPGLLEEIGRARASGRDWEALMRRYGVDGALVRYDERRRPVLVLGADGEPELEGYRTSNALLFPRSLYALVHWDDAAMLLVRRTPERRAWLAEEAYEAIDPEDLEWTVERAAEDPTFRDRALAEVGRWLGEEPDVRRAQHLRERLLRQGD